MGRFGDLQVDVEAAADLGDLARLGALEDAHAHGDGEHERLVGELRQAREGEDELSGLDAATPLFQVLVAALEARDVALQAGAGEALRLLVGVGVVLQDLLGRQVPDLHGDQRDVDGPILDGAHSHVPAGATRKDDTEAAHGVEQTVRLFGEDVGVLQGVLQFWQGRVPVQHLRRSRTACQPNAAPCTDELGTG